MSVDAQQNATPWTPTPNQAAVLEAAQEAGPNRSVSAICKSAGVDRTRFYAWVKEDPDFKAAWEGIWQGTLKRHLPPVVAAMVQKAQKGDVPAARLVAELAGVLKQRVEERVTHTHKHEGAVLVIGGTKEEYIGALQRARNGQQPTLPH